MCMCCRRRRAYPSDVTDKEWAILEPLIPAAKPGGRPQEIDCMVFRLQQVAVSCHTWTPDSQVEEASIQAAQQKNTPTTSCMNEMMSSQKERHTNQAPRGLDAFSLARHLPLS